MISSWRNSGDTFFNKKLADITHCGWEELGQKEMTKRRRGEGKAEVKRVLKERKMGKK